MKIPDELQWSFDFLTSSNIGHQILLEESAGEACDSLGDAVDAVGDKIAELKKQLAEMTADRDEYKRLFSGALVDVGCRVREIREVIEFAKRCGMPADEAHGYPFFMVRRWLENWRKERADIESRRDFA